MAFPSLRILAKLARICVHPPMFAYINGIAETVIANRRCRRHRHPFTDRSFTHSSSSSSSLSSSLLGRW
jgi:hypothetical protein